MNIWEKYKEKHALIINKKSDQESQVLLIKLLICFTLLRGTILGTWFRKVLFHC